MNHYRVGALDHRFEQYRLDVLVGNELGKSGQRYRFVLVDAILVDRGPDRYSPRRGGGRILSTVLSTSIGARATAQNRDDEAEFLAGDATGRVVEFLAIVEAAAEPVPHERR